MAADIDVDDRDFDVRRAGTTILPGTVKWFAGRGPADMVAAPCREDGDRPLPLPALVPLLLFAVSVLALAMYVIVVAGYFGEEARPGPMVSQLLAGSALALVFAVRTAIFAVYTLAWPYAVIAGGFAVLAAPFTFRLLPLTTFEGQRGMMLFGALFVAGLIALAVAQ